MSLRRSEEEGVSKAKNEERGCQQNHQNRDTTLSVESNPGQSSQEPVEEDLHSHYMNLNPMLKAHMVASAQGDSSEEEETYEVRGRKRKRHTHHASAADSPRSPSRSPSPLTGSLPDDLRATVVEGFKVIVGKLDHIVI